MAHTRNAISGGSMTRLADFVSNMSMFRTLRTAAVTVLGALLIACNGGSTNNTELSVPLPQKIRDAQLVQTAVGAEVEIDGEAFPMTRDGDSFTATVFVDPGLEFDYRIVIFELVNGVRVDLAIHEDSTTVSEDTAIPIGNAYEFPDQDNDGFTNLDERIALSEYNNSFSTPDNIDGTPTRAGLAQFAQSTYSVAEDTGTLSIQVLRLAGSQGAVTARYELNSETATAGQDFRASSGQLSWADGETAPRTIFVNVFSDDDSEGTETFTASLFSVSGNLAIGNGITRISIEDSTPPAEPGTIALALSEVSVSEDAGSVDLTVERTGGSDNAVSVQYSFADVSATNNSDYTGNNGTLNWADGDSSARTISVPISTDSDDEATETFTVTLSAATGGAILGNASVTVSIQDSTPTPEPGQLVLSANSYTFSEGTTGTITVQRTNGGDGAQTVDYAFVAGTATAGADFSATNGQLSWADGDEGARQISIVVNSDNQVEPAETLTLQLSNPVGGATVPTTSASITLNDDTAVPVPGNVQLTAPFFSVTEGGSVEVSVERLNGQDGAISIDYFITAGSATANSDYSDTSGTLQWTDGDTGNRTLSISALNDDVIEADETLTVELSNPSGGTTTLRRTAIVTIIDNTPDLVPGTISVAAQSGAINEGQTRQIIVQRTGGSDGAVSVDFQAATGTADATDFVAAAGQLNWADGDSSDRTIDITASSDALVEGNETFTLQLSSPGGGASLGQATLTLTITDTTVVPEPGRIEFLATDGLVDEGDTISLLVGRRDGSDGSVSVNWSITNGTANGADFTGGSGTLQWADGDTGNRTISIATNQDALVEGDENLTVNLSSPNGGATLGLASVTVTIVDTTVAPTPGTLAFSAGQSGVTEGNGTSIAVNRTGGGDGAVSVNYAITGGSASAADHDLTSGTLSWADGDTGNRSISLNAATDALTEGPETLVITLSGATGGASIGSATHTLTINDDPPDPTPGSLAFATTTGSVNEGSSTSIAVNRGGGSDGTVSVDFAVTGGTASAGDHNVSSGTLSWNDGDTADKTILAGALTDALTEGTETLEITLSNPTGGATLGSATFTLDIVDDAPDPVPGTLAFSSTSQSVSEGSSTTIEVTRSGGTDGAVSIAYAVSGGSASTDDHDIASNTLNWADGDASPRTILVNAASDALTEGDETVELTLSSPTGGASLGQAALTLTITDVVAAQPGTLAVSDTTVEVDEGASATMAVSRTGGSDGAVSVSYSVTGGSATSDVDFTLAAGQLDWADGDTADKTINLTALADSDVEASPETVIVTLASPTGGASLGTATGTFNITDTTVAPQPGTLQFELAAISIAEGDSIDILVERINGSSGEVQVSYTVTDQTTTSADHDAVSGVLTFADGSAAAQTIALQALTDADTEVDETLQITLSAPTGGATLGLATIDITITDTPPAAKFAALDTDGQWPVCFESSEPTSATAWAVQPDSYDGRPGACVKHCSNQAVAGALPGWGYDQADQHACVFTQSTPGSLASAPVYAPTRIAFATDVNAQQLLLRDGSWQCREQNRASGEAEFAHASDTIHELDFDPDGTYQYQQITGFNSSSALGVWSITDRSLRLNHLGGLHRNLEFASNTQLNLYLSDTHRFSCRLDVN